MEEESRSYSFLERLMFYTLPVLFTLLLTGVLLTVFGYDVVNEALRIGNRIPGVATALPDPKPTEEELRAAIEEAARTSAAEAETTTEEQAAQTAAELSAKDAEIAELTQSLEAKDAQIAKLEEELATATRTAEAQAATAEQYAASIRQLARVYADMKPSRAAPILEALTLSERVLVMKEMTEDQQVGILERMTPEIAAETSILMKDIVPSENLQIAALQERLALDGAAGQAGAPLSRAELSETIAQMAPDAAAEVLLAMAKADEARVVGILQTMEQAARATILNSLAELDTERTARIASKLG